MKHHTDTPAAAARRVIIAAAAILAAAAAMKLYTDSDRFERSLCWYDHDTTRYYFATLALFSRNRADDRGEEWDRPDWRDADADQEQAALSVPRWVRRHVDSHVHRYLGWDDRAGWAK